MLTPLNILVVDDETNIRKTLAMCLEGEGYSVSAVSNAADARSEVADRVFDAVFLDLRLGNEDGMKLIPPFLAAAPWMKIIVITAFGTIESAVEAMKLGAYDYIPKPFSVAQVRHQASRVLELRSLERRINTFEQRGSSDVRNPDFESANARMQHAIAIAQEAAQSEATMLFLGESGTGKTQLARSVHKWSERRDKPFTVVSCPALSSELLESELFGHVRGAFTGAIKDYSGKIAASEGGTLLLDEIGDLAPGIQSKLLRFLQDRQFERVGDSRTQTANVRILAATNRRLEEAVEARTFREDLYYRLNVIGITLPPLRERREDIEPLAVLFLREFAAQNRRQCTSFTFEAMETLRNYSWKGNIRELRNAVERAVVLCRGESVGVENLPQHIAGAGQEPRLGDRLTLQQIEELHIRKILSSTSSLQEASEILGIDQATLWRRRKAYGI